MKKLRVKLPLIAIAVGLVCASPALAQPTPQQPPPPAPKAKTVVITTQPSLEVAHDDTAIIRWTTNNPGGSDEHLAVVTYGTRPDALTQTAKSHIRLNRGHPDTTFRVRMDGLQPSTTYYYKVTSMEANGTNDGVESEVNQFTTPPSGQRIVAYPPQPRRTPRRQAERGDAVMDEPVAALRTIVPQEHRRAA